MFGSLNVVQNFTLSPNALKHISAKCAKSCLNAKWEGKKNTLYYSLLRQWIHMHIIFFYFIFFEGTASRKIITVSGDLAMNHISLQLLEVYRNDLAWQRAVFLLQTIRMKYENWSTFSTKFKSYLSKLLPLSKRSSIMLL